MEELVAFVLDWIGRRLFAPGTHPGVDQRWALDAANLAARDLGLEVARGMNGPLVHGLVGALRVDAAVWVEVDRDEKRLVYDGTVAGASPVPSFRPPGPTPFGALPTGDAAFDARVQVTADRAPWWSAATRAAVLRCVEAGGTAAGRSIQVDPQRLGRAAGTADLAAALTAAVEALVAMGVPGDPQTLAAEDPVPSVRARALRVVVAEPVDPAWLAARLEDPEPGVAVIAALAAGPAGRERLPALLAADRDGSVVRAVAGVLPPGHPGFDAALARALAQAPDLELVRIAADRGSVVVVPALRALTPPLRAAARDAVRAIQDRAAGERGGVSLAATGDAGGLAEAADAGWVSDSGSGQEP